MARGTQREDWIFDADSLRNAWELRVGHETSWVRWFIEPFWGRDREQMYMLGAEKVQETHGGKVAYQC